jgi:DNA-binding CsgD family transcriptional regulator
LYNFGSDYFYLNKRPFIENSDMIRLVILCVFLISVALAATSLVITTQLRKKYKLDFISSLLYQQAFYFMFGFYALWGQAVIIPFFEELAGSKWIEMITSITLLLGFPFVIFAWLMFLELSRELSGRRPSSSLIAWFLAIHIVLLIILTLILAKHTEIEAFNCLKFIYIICSTLYTSAGIVLLNVGGASPPLITRIDRRNLSLGLAGFILLQNSVLLIYDGSIWQSLVFIFLFFSGHSFIALYLRYKSDLSGYIEKPAVHSSLDQFCRQFEISPREREVIAEICNGLSNQQIAEKLFISLQTVKDHTHRIYSKVEVPSRSQLIRMVQEIGQTNKP